MSFQQLLDIQHQAAVDAAEQASRPPVACPEDGTPLETGTDGTLHCSFCGRLDGST